MVRSPAGGRTSAIRRVLLALLPVAVAGGAGSRRPGAEESHGKVRGRSRRWWWRARGMEGLRLGDEGVAGGGTRLASETLLFE